MYRLALLIATGCTAPVVEPMTPVPGDPDVLPDPFFDEVIAGEPREIAVRVSEADAEALRSDPRSWVPATVTFDGRELGARVRLKGHGSFEPFDSRPSMKIEFEHAFYGRRTVILNNGHSDSGRMYERLAAEAFRLSGVPAARAGNIWVELQGEGRGMYTVLEDVDSRLLQQWFESGDGALYEVFDGDFTPALLSGIEHEEGPTADALIDGVVASLALGDVVGFDAACEFIDREAFLRFFAVTAAVGQGDAYPYSQPGDDIYLYADPSTDKLHFLPHGLDEAFGTFIPPLNRVNGMLARRCLADEVCRQELALQLEQVFDVLEGPWEEERARVQERNLQWTADPRWVGTTTFFDDLPSWTVIRRGILQSELQEFADL